MPATRHFRMLKAKTLELVGRLLSFSKSHYISLTILSIFLGVVSNWGPEIVPHYFEPFEFFITPSVVYTCFVISYLLIGQLVYCFLKEVFTVNMSKRPIIEIIFFLIIIASYFTYIGFFPANKTAIEVNELRKTNTSLRDELEKSKKEVHRLNNEKQSGIYIDPHSQKTKEGKTLKYYFDILLNDDGSVPYKDDWTYRQKGWPSLLRYPYKILQKKSSNEWYMAFYIRDVAYANEVVLQILDLISDKDKRKFLAGRIKRPYQDFNGDVIIFLETSLSSVHTQKAFDMQDQIKKTKDIPLNLVFKDYENYK